MCLFLKYTFLITVVSSSSIAEVLPTGSSIQGKENHKAPYDGALKHRDIHVYTNAQFTILDSGGPGTCNMTYAVNDNIVALNSEQYNGGTFCFNEITLTANGKTTQARVADECVLCPYGGLDLSESLFSYFANTSAGVVNGSWFFTDDSEVPASPSITSTSTIASPSQPEVIPTDSSIVKTSTGRTGTRVSTTLALAIALPLVFITVLFCLVTRRWCSTLGRKLSLPILYSSQRRLRSSSIISWRSPSSQGLTGGPSEQEQYEACGRDGTPDLRPITDYQDQYNSEAWSSEADDAGSREAAVWPSDPFDNVSQHIQALSDGTHEPTSQVITVDGGRMNVSDLRDQLVRMRDQVGNLQAQVAELGWRRSGQDQEPPLYDDVVSAGRRVVIHQVSHSRQESETGSVAK